jgi:hypothetical protein
VQIICKDGTTIQCADFEAIDSGVLFFQDTPSRRAEAGEEEEEEEEEERKADGFVPVTELHFVLPDEMVQQTPQRGGAQQQARGQVPPGATQQGGMSQQQQMQQHPGGPGQPGR